MRTLIGLTLALLAGPALADRIPIEGTYGSNSACSMLVIGGPELVYLGGLSADGKISVPLSNEEEPLFLLQADSLIGPELECEVEAVADEYTGFACGAEMGPGHLTATILKRPDHVTMIFKRHAVNLRRC